MRSRSIVAVVAALLAFTACRTTADDPRVSISELEDRRVARPAAWEVLLTRGNEESRARAARAVGRVRDAALTAALVRAIDVERSDRVVGEQLFALGQIADSSALDVLLKELESQVASRRAAAAEAIGKLGVPRVAPNLVAHLADPAAEVRGASLLALARLVGRRAKLAPAESLDRESQQRFLHEVAGLLADMDENVRWKAAYALSEVEFESEPRVALLVDAAKSASPATGAKNDDAWQIRYFAAAGLARATGADALRKKALAELFFDHNRQVAAAARVAGSTQWEGPAAMEALLSNRDCARRATDRYLRVRAIRELGKHEQNFEWVRATLIDLCSDRDVYVASEAFDALANLARASVSSASTKRELLEIARHGVAANDLAIVGNAFELLNVVGSKDDEPLVVAAYERLVGVDNAEVRCDAVRSAATLAGKGAVEFLRRAKLDESPAVVAAAKEEWRKLDLADDPAPARVLEGRPGADLDVGGRPSSIAIESGVDFLRSAPNPKVAFHFAKGDVVVELLREEAPRHVKMLLTRVRLGQCDGLPIHRVVPGFVAQGFDPRGDGWGSGGVFLRDEINRVPFERGAVGMPNTGPDSGGCQLFVSLVPTPHLDGRYTVFGRVVAGMDVVDQLEVGDVCTRAEEVR